jgi:hypothetical protein
MTGPYTHERRPTMEPVTFDDFVGDAPSVVTEENRQASDVPHLEELVKKLEKEARDTGSIALQGVNSPDQYEHPLPHAA